MVPMLSNIDESLQVLSLIEETKQELSEKNIDYDKNILFPSTVGKVKMTVFSSSILHCP